MTYSSPHLIRAVDNLAERLDQLSRALDQQSAATDCCPVPVYNCSAQSVEWVYPPGGSGSSKGLDPDTGGGELDEQSGTIPGFGGSTKQSDDYGIGYGDPAVETPDGSADWDEYDAELCRKAHWFVAAARDLLGELLTASAYTQWSVGGVNTIRELFVLFLGRGALVRYVGEVAVPVFAGAASLPVTVALILLGAVAGLVGLAARGAILDLYDDIAADLICAIYNGKSPAGIKAGWDATIDNATNWFAPQRVLLKGLMYGEMADSLSNANLAAVGDWVSDCSACLPETRVAYVYSWTELVPGPGISGQKRRYQVLWDGGCPFFGKDEQQTATGNIFRVSEEGYEGALGNGFVGAVTTGWQVSVTSKGGDVRVYYAYNLIYLMEVGVWWDVTTVQDACFIYSDDEFEIEIRERP